MYTIPGRDSSIGWVSIEQVIDDQLKIPTVIGTEIQTRVDDQPVIHAPDISRKFLVRIIENGTAYPSKLVEPGPFVDVPGSS